MAGTLRGGLNYAPPSPMRRSIWVVLGLAVAACVPPASGTSVATNACTTKAHAKYDGTQAKQIEDRLKQETAQVSWDAVPEPYRGWAAQHLDAKLSAAAVTLAASGNCKEIEAAASKIKGLGKRIAEVAKECNDAECVAKPAAPPEIERKLDAAVCPLFPFC